MNWAGAAMGHSHSAVHSAVIGMAGAALAVAIAAVIVVVIVVASLDFGYRV